MVGRDESFLVAEAGRLIASPQRQRRQDDGCRGAGYVRQINYSTCQDLAIRNSSLSANHRGLGSGSGCFGERLVVPTERHGHSVAKTRLPCHVNPL
jgi:hypothetical protein